MKRCLYCGGSGIQDNLGWDLPKSWQPSCEHCDGEGWVTNVKWIVQIIKFFLWRMK
jgi:DnaJ-class molecular chaperone